MFGRDDRNMAATLQEMHRVSLWRTNSNQGEARELFRNYLKDDRRFEGYDKDRLMDAVTRCRSNGAALDLQDPYLFKGGQKRPLSW
jgi:hypothetical protein